MAAQKCETKGKRDFLRHSRQMHIHRCATHMKWTGQQRKATMSRPRQKPEVRLWKVRLGKGIVVDGCCGLICGLLWDMDFTSGGKDGRSMVWKTLMIKGKNHDCLGWGAHQHPHARAGWIDWAMGAGRWAWGNAWSRPVSAAPCNDTVELLSSPNPQCITFGQPAVFGKKTQNL